MDFSKFDTKTASDRGRFLHLTSPETGEKLYDETLTDPETGSKVGLWIYGPTSERYKAQDKKMRDAKMERLRIKRGGRIKGLSGGEDDDRRLYASLVFKTVGISWGTLDGVQEVDVEAVEKLFDRFPFIEDQAKDFVDEDANWMGER